MRAVLGAVSVEVQVRFAGDLLHVAELDVTQVGKCYQVGLATTAQLPLPLAPFNLLSIAGDRLELRVPDSMAVELGASVVIRWRSVEISVVPSLPSGKQSWRRRRGWPVELLSSAAATGMALLTILPAMLLLMALADRTPILHAERPVRSRIVYTWSEPTEKSEPAPRLKAAAREAEKKAQAHPQKTSASANGEASDHAQKNDVGFAESAGADHAHAEQKHHAQANRTQANRAQADARDGAARTGILGALDGHARFAASAASQTADATEIVFTLSKARGAEAGASGGSSGAPGGGDSGASGGGDSGAASLDGDSGTLQGSDPGDAFGAGGLGLSGTGEGGGGGDGTIGLGNLGTIGHGGGEGTGSGYGSGAGGLGGHRAYAPEIVSRDQIQGALDKEMIRRVIRRHLNEVRFCYESALQKAPTLTGRVLVEFVIQPDGSVATSQAQASTVADSAVADCTARAFLRWQFPSVRGGGAVLVHYPFDFVMEGL